MLIPRETTHALVFDRDLLRVAGIGRVPVGARPITLTTMAQMSNATPRREVDGDAGRGPLPAAQAQALVLDIESLAGRR